jgi:hypothetical protein
MSCATAVMTNKEIISEFEQGRAPGGSFHHADHVRVAFAYVSQYAFLEAATKFCAALKRFAAAAGKPGLYHETISIAYLALINERRAHSGGEQTWEEFARENDDLLVWKGGVLERYYSRQALFSEPARRVFILPDRCFQCSSLLEAEALPR